MLELLKEMCNLAGNLSNVIEKTGKSKDQKKLWARYVDLVNQIDKLGRITFDENDKVYQETIDKIKNTEKLFKEFIDNQAKLAGIFRPLTSIIANVEKMLLGWKIEKFSEIDAGKWPKS